MRASPRITAERSTDAEGAKAGRTRPEQSEPFVVPHEPLPDWPTLKRAFAAFARKAEAPPRPDDLGARDPGFIRDILPFIGALYDHYFRAETEFVEPLVDGPLLAVGNHNAMTGMPDMFCHMVAFWRTSSPERKAYGLMHDVPFTVPGAGSWLNASGAIRASRLHAERALAEGSVVLVFPGGDLDACKPTRRQYDVDFGRRRGFIRTAIRAQVPVVPVVSVGAHQGLYLATDGRRIAEALHLPQLARSNVFPIGFALPWGLICGIPIPHLPPPVKIHTRVGPVLHLSLPREAADDDTAVEHAYQRVVSVMRASMEELRQAGRHGLFPRT